MIVVKFSNDHEQSVQITPETKVVDVLSTLALSFGLTDTSEFVKEWGLTEYQGDQKWIDKSWLRNEELLADSTSAIFLLGKKFFTTNDDIHLLTIPPFLREVLYHQMLQIYLCGGYFSPAQQAIKLSALAAHVHMSTAEYLTYGTEWLQTFLPPRLSRVRCLPSLIGKNMKGIGARNKAVVETAFIKGIMRLESFGLSLYSANIDHQPAVLGVGFKGLFWLDTDNFEPIKQWPPEAIKQISQSDDTLLVSFNGREADIEIESPYTADISHYISSSLRIHISRPSSYALEAGGDDDSSHTGIEIVNVQEIPSVEIRKEKGRRRGRGERKAAATKEAEDVPGAAGLDRKRRISPFGRYSNRRKAFRKKKNLLTKEDSLEDLSEVMGVDFNSVNPSWAMKGNGVNPVYDSVASTRVDTLLKLSKLTSPSLSTTLKHTKRSSVLNHRVPLPYEEVTFPPPLPQKPPHFRTSLLVEVKTKGVPTPPVEEVGAVPQRLGMYVPGGGGQHSRPVQPYEALRDYATLRREFRMFCVKLPNGNLHWELASLYQPIHKLISRLCILIHAESNMEQYSLFVEGGILSQLKENTPLTPDIIGNDMDREFEFELSRVAPPRNGMNSMGKVFVPSKKHQILPVMDNPVILDSKLTFKDHGITTSRLLSLKSASNERLPKMAIKVPDWVKFHQSWLSIVHGNQPCQLQDAITLAAVLYQCYVLDRTEANSVISSCNITDFLPVGFSGIKGIKDKILKEREKILSYTREELEQIYITGATSSPLHQTVFFPCKEPKRQFLKSARLVPIIIGINQQGIVRVDPKSCEIMNIWSYEVFKNWGFSRKSFLLEFESSTYPIKCNQSKWMSRLVDFYVNSIQEIKHQRIEDELEEVREEEEEGHTQSSDVAKPYFVLEEEAPALATATNPYFVLEKVYEELMQVRDTTMQRQKKQQEEREREEGAKNAGATGEDKTFQVVGEKRVMDGVYVNPLPNCSLINPSEATTMHLQKLGLVPLRDHEEEEEEEEELEEEDERKYFTVINYSESSSDWEENDEEENPYDDILNVLTQFHHSKRQTPVISEHIYYLPPDCYQPEHHL